MKAKIFILFICIAYQCFASDPIGCVSMIGTIRTASGIPWVTGDRFELKLRKTDNTFYGSGSPLAVQAGGYYGQGFCYYTGAEPAEVVLVHEQTKIEYHINYDEFNKLTWTEGYFLKETETGGVIQNYPQYYQNYSASVTYPNGNFISDGSFENSLTDFYMKYNSLEIIYGADNRCPWWRVASTTGNTSTWVQEPPSSAGWLFWADWQGKGPSDPFDRTKYFAGVVDDQTAFTGNHIAMVHVKNGFKYDLFMKKRVKLEPNTKYIVFLYLSIENPDGVPFFINSDGIIKTSGNQDVLPEDILCPLLQIYRHRDDFSIEVDANGDAQSFVNDDIQQATMTETPIETGKATSNLRPASNGIEDQHYAMRPYYSEFTTGNNEISYNSETFVLELGFKNTNPLVRSSVLPLEYIYKVDGVVIQKATTKKEYPILTEGATYTDGLNRKIGTRARDGLADVNTHIYYDEIGRMSKTTIPYFHTNKHLFPTNGITLASNNNSSDPYPYNETAYWQDPLGRASVIAAPGAQFNNTTSHIIRKYYGVIPGSGVDDVEGNPLAITENYYLTLDFTNSVSNPEIKQNGRTSVTTRDYFVEATTDENYYSTHVVSFIVTDRFGRTVATQTGLNNAKNRDGVTPTGFTAADILISTNVYDINGNLIKSTSPQGLSTRYAYNSLNQLIEKTTPDQEGATHYWYDRAGRLRVYQDPLGAYYNYVIVNKYDLFGRLIAIYKRYQNGEGKIDNSPYDNTYYTIDEILDMKNSARDEYWPFAKYQLPGTSTAEKQRLKGILCEYGYDRLTYYELRNLHSIYNRFFTLMSQTFISELKNLENKRVYDLSFGEQNKMAQVLNLYSYDLEGRLTAKYQIVGGMKPVMSTYSYNESGKLIYERNYEIGVDLSKPLNVNSATTAYAYEYDNMGRVKRVRRLATMYSNSQVLAEYAYNARGQIDTTRLGGGPTNALQDIKYLYNIRGWLTNINDNANPATDLFIQKLGYYDNGDMTATSSDMAFKSNASSQYNGNILWQFSAYPQTHETAGGKTISTSGYLYGYDNFNRLQNARMGYWNTSEEKWKDYPEENYNTKNIQYSKDGDILGMIQNENGTDALIYNYVENSHKIRSISGKATDWVPGEKSAEGNYSYDHNGNIVLDKSKNMEIRYDFRNLPVVFKLSIPNPDLEAGPGTVWKQDVEIIYDADGKRVMKIRR